MVRTAARPKIIIGVLLIGCFAFLVLGASARKFGRSVASRNLPQPHVSNKTKSIQVSSVKRLDNGDIELQLLNQSNTAIYAYQMVTNRSSFGKQSITTLATESPLQAGQTQTEKIGSSNIDPSNAEIELSALYSEGGSLEGDADESAKLKQTMSAIKDQARVALQLFTTASTSSEQNTDKLMQSLESQVAAATGPSGSSGARRDYETGRNFINGRLTKEMKKLRMRNARTGEELRGHVRDLISYYQRLVEKL